MDLKLLVIKNKKNNQLNLSLPKKKLPKELIKDIQKKNLLG